MQVILCFISSLLSPGKAGYAFAKLAFLLFGEIFFNLVFIVTAPTVYLQSCKAYSYDALFAFFQRCFYGADVPSLRGAKVLIKPNLISAAGKGLACTHPLFLVALADWLQFSGAKVVVGDSPAFGKAVNVLKALGVDKQLANREIEIIEFDRAVVRRLHCGVEVAVAAQALECDFFINAAKLKAHSQMYVTIASKNIFGIVKGIHKAMLHMRYGGGDNGFSRIILDLIELLPPHLSVVDGIDAMHEHGPVRGSCLNVGCLAFSSDPVAIDTALLHALELEPGRSPLWQEAKERGWPGATIAKIRFPLQSPETFFGSMFAAPMDLAPIRFSPFRFVRGNFKRFSMRVMGK